MGPSVDGLARDTPEAVEIFRHRGMQNACATNLHNEVRVDSGRITGHSEVIHLGGIRAIRTPNEVRKKMTPRACPKTLDLQSL
jgi:hypothetical protein